MLPGRGQESGQSGGNPADTRQGKKRLTRMLIGSKNYCKYAFADNSHSNHLPPRLKSPKAKKDCPGVNVLGHLLHQMHFVNLMHLVHASGYQEHDVNRAHHFT